MSDADDAGAGPEDDIAEDRARRRGDRTQQGDAAGETGGIRGGGGRDRPAEISFMRLLNVLLEHRKAVVGAPLAAAVLFVAVAVLAPEQYTSSATFLPQDQERQLSQLSGLASQLGMALPTSLTGGRSPAFYADLVRSQNLLRQVVTHDYPAAGEAASGDSAPADLVEFFDVPGDTRPLRVANAVGVLREKLSTGADTETGVVSLSITTRRPELSRQVAERVIDLVNVFNLERRRSQAEAERKFLERRVEEARKDLEAAEDSLEKFLERNRSFESSPQLRFRHQSLQRQVDLEQQVYMSLAQSLQEARIAEVRSTPVITVVEPPQEPAKPDGRSLLLVALLGVAVGALAAVAWALGSQYFRAARRSEPDEYARFAELRRRAADDLRGLWNRVRRRR